MSKKRKKLHMKSKTLLTPAMEAALREEAEAGYDATKLRGVPVWKNMVDDVQAAVGDLMPEGVDPPSPEAVENYMLAFDWADANPDKASAFMAMPSDEIHEIATAIAFAGKTGVSQDECLTVASSIRTWHILNGYTFFYDWWTTPIAAMSDQQIVDQLRADGLRFQSPSNE